ncbi:pyridoxamine 5'-phosphate oxidase family protein [Pseudahrensia aquimaris]|uniref:Pyridoxamine 5'-phosphate oxidase family protein n=1 Tax=Pseudahrensia aquimaris TaxID=744461 RepID=A0ABW3FDF0_9HYPH
MSKDIDKLWDMISKPTACMVTTVDDGVLRSRPMAPYIDKKARTIRFITDRTSAKVEELHHDRDLALNFVNEDAMQYVSISGRGEVSADRGLITEMWGPYCDVFFGGDPKTADVVVITVKPDQAEFWDNDKGSIAMAYSFAKAYFTDEGPDLGDNAKLDMAS